VICSWSMAEASFGLLCSSMLSYNALLRTYWRKQPSSGDDSGDITWRTPSSKPKRRFGDTLEIFGTTSFPTQTVQSDVQSSGFRWKSKFDTKSYGTCSTSDESKIEMKSLTAPENVYDPGRIHVTQEVSVKARSGEPKKWNSPC
jgi:hypothetical protein